MNLQIISYTFIIITFIIAFYKFKIINKAAEKNFVYYLGFVVLGEIIQKIQQSFFEVATFFNINVYDIVTYSFFIYWYYKIIGNKSAIKLVGVIYFLGLCISLFKEDIFNEYLAINNYIGTISTLILTILFYITLLKKNEVISFLSDPKFWISTGLLIFNIGYIPVLFLLKYRSKRIDVDLTMVILVVTMYSCFIKGLLCYRTKTK